jgi:dihydrofolate reductase
MSKAVSNTEAGRPLTSTRSRAGSCSRTWPISTPSYSAVRPTRSIFAAYWPQGPEEIPFTALLNNAPKYVASRTLESVEWNNSNLIQGESANEVPRLKEQYGKIHVSGSADLMQTLLRHDLVDQLSLWVYPVVLGTGKKLFADGAVPATLELLESATFGKGTVLLRYRRAGKLTYGDLARDAH